MKRFDIEWGYLGTRHIESEDGEWVRYDDTIGLVDWLGLALELEAQAKRVESKSAMRAMYSAARGLRLIGGQK